MYSGGEDEAGALRLSGYSMPLVTFQVCAVLVWLREWECVCAFQHDCVRSSKAVWLVLR